MKILWDERAWEEYLEWQTQDKRTLKKSMHLSKIYKGIVTKGLLRRDWKTGTIKE